MRRPDLDKTISLADFNDFYWLKEELQIFCKREGISTGSSKIDLTKKIQHYLLTGRKSFNAQKKTRVKSKFDWNTEVLSDSTLITDSYKNTEQVRLFFIKHIGTHFSFNVQFMKWMKENSGKTLGNAIYEWKRLREIKKDKNQKMEIAPQFEYNRYMRAFLNDNPTLSINDAMRFWKLKSTIRGTNVYERTDLNIK